MTKPLRLWDARREPLLRGCIEAARCSPRNCGRARAPAAKKNLAVAVFSAATNRNIGNEFCFTSSGEVASTESTQMICQQFEQLAPQIAHNELRDAKLLQDAINHAASCAACDAILVEARELAASVASLAAHDKALDSAAHLEFTLRAAFAREHAGGSTWSTVNRLAPTNAIRPSNVFAEPP